MRPLTTILFFVVAFASQASAQAFNWSVTAGGSIIEVEKSNLPLQGQVFANKLVFGADLPSAQQVEVGAAYVTSKPGVLLFSIPIGAPSGPMKFVGTATVPSNGKLFIIEDSASCSAVNFTPQRTGTYESCYFPNNFTQSASDYLIVGSTVSNQDYFSVNTSNFIKSTGNVVTLNNVILRRDPVTQKYGALKVMHTKPTGGQKDTLNLTSANIDGWLWGQGEINVNGTVKTVGMGSITLANGTMNINGPSGVGARLKLTTCAGLKLTRCYSGVDYYAAVDKSTRL